MIEKQKQYHKRYYQSHKKKWKEYCKRYCQTHKKEKKEYNRRYRQKYKRKKQEYDRQYYQSHKREAMMYRQSHSEYFKEYNKQYRQKNRRKIRIDKIKYKMIRKNIGGSFTLKEWDNKKKEYNYCCVVCGVSEQKLLEKTGMGLTIDHKIPVSKWKKWAKINKPKYQCNDIENIQPLCMSCNCRKNNKILST
jgi:hypothetical protein